MSKGKPIALHRTERVVAVVPEQCSGPGWSNGVVWVYIEDVASMKMRCEAIQPEERSSGLHALFLPGAEMAAALLGAVHFVRSDDKESKCLRK